jgi:2-hydroxy-6-oxonona-2,4-dienedioate hydrolase
MTITEDSTSRYAQVRVGDDNLRIHYHDAGSGPAVVFLHGAGAGAGGWSNFSRNLPAFVEAGFRVIAMDFPGFNKSDPFLPTTSRTALNAQAVNGLLACLEIERAHLVGNSLGGATALAFALNHPDRLDRLVLMGPGSLGPSLFQALPMEGIKLLLQLYREPTRENLDRMLKVFVYDPSMLTPELVERRYEGMVSSPTHLSNFVTSFQNNPGTLIEDLSPRLAEIQNQTLVVWGRDDRFVPLDYGLRLVWSLPRADLQIFSRCGHWAQWEHAEKFNSMVLDFLKR